MKTEKKGINRNIVLIGLIIGMFFSALEQTIVGTAMPTIIEDLNGLTLFAWVTTAYMLTSTTVVPIVGKLADMFGSRGMYLLGMVIFVGASFLCATATTMEQLVSYRAVQGIGGGMIMPLSQTIVGLIFSAEQRAKWQGVFGGIFGLSSVIGPFIGGFLVDAIDWKWIFLVNIPFGLLSAVLIFMGLKNEKIALEVKPKIDYLGIITLIPAVVSLLLGLTFAGDKFEWLSSTSLLVFGGSLIFFLIFIMVERQAAEPILDLSLFKNRVFATTNMLGFLLGLGMFGAIMFIPMFMQGVMGVSPTKAGSAMTPMMIALIISSILGGQLLLRMRYRYVLAAGMLISTVGFMLMSTMGIHTTTWTIYSYMVILGVGMGLVMPSLTIIVQSEYPKNMLGTVTSSSTFFRSIGGTIGATVLSTVMNQTLPAKMTDMMKTEEVTSNPVVSKTLETIGSDYDKMFGVLIKPDALQMPADLTNLVLNPIKIAWSQSLSVVFLTGLVFIALGIVIAFTVGNGKIKRDREMSGEAVQTEQSSV
ncbi:MFS transporter [Paenibacillus sp. N1-5-1-14]|uniref:MDR family MFS transporter n=1 Tax=Paenibacillus radicibacter TaxID=2972488 RepID=UPI002158ECC5|nr:MDR family MFS transporter [Paenibacillus radicibacter]MCR8642082.1 MFS transporter [Paenibacillus radicibacter]